MNTATTTDTAQQVALAANGALRRRAANVDPFDWSDHAAMRRYIAVIESGIVWRVDAHTVAGNVAATPDGLIWGYVIADALDSAASDIGGIVLDEGHIESHPGGARLTF